ncbi:hypothetical protein ACFXTO_041815 [Malus domestica]
MHQKKWKLKIRAYGASSFRAFGSSLSNSTPSPIYIPSVSNRSRCIFLVRSNKRCVPVEVEAEDQISLYGASSTSTSLVHIFF